MVNVNQTFVNLINSGNYTEEISGTLKNGSGATVLNLENDFIKIGSMTIDNKCINNKDLEPGAVYSAELKITITAEAGLTNAQKSALQNGSLNLTYTVKDFETGETSASCSLGIYYITAVELIDDETVITAEDLLSRMSRNITDEDRETLEANGFTPYELLLMAAEACSTAHRPISIANDEAEFDTWTNSAEVFMLPETADITTYRDLVAETAAILGCFATVDKVTNGLILKRLNPHTNNNVYTVPDDLQFENTKSSYVCKTGKVYLGENYFYPATEDDEVNGLLNENINDFVIVKKHESTPDYARLIKDGSCRYCWREIISNGIESDERVYPFTNGAFYINRQINFFLRRQDPKKINLGFTGGITDKPFDYVPDGEDISNYPNYNQYYETNYRANEIEEC